MTKRKTPSRKAMDMVEDKLDEINSNPDVIKDNQAKLESITQHEDEAIDMANSAANTNKRRRRTESSDEPNCLDIVGAWKRHGLLNPLFAHTSNVFKTKTAYTIGCSDGESAFLMIQDEKEIALMKFTPRALEELKWRIDDVLVEMGLAAINVKSASDHLWRSSPQRK